MSQFISLRGVLVLSLAGFLAVRNFREPKFGVMAFLILLFLRDAFLMVWLPPVYTVLHLPLVFGVLTLISLFLHSREYPFLFPPQLWLMFSLFAVVCLSRMLAGTGVFSHEVTGEFLKMCILSFMIVNSIRSEKDMYHIIYAIIATSTFSVLYHYYYYRIGAWATIFSQTTLHGLDRNYFAAALASTVPLAHFAIRASENRKLRILLGICFLSLAGGIILTYSRGGSLALGLALALVILLDKQRFKVASLILILCLLASFRVSEKYIDRLESILTYEEDASSMGRVATSQAAVNMLKSHPLFGVGAGNYNYVFLEYVSPDLSQWVREGKSIHNVFLQMASETGLAGMLVFSLLLLKCSVDFINLRSRCSGQEHLKALCNVNNALGAGFLTYLFALLFIPGAYYSYIYVYIPLIAAARQIHRQYEGENERAIETEQQQIDAQHTGELPEEGIADLR